MSQMTTFNWHTQFESASPGLSEGELRSLEAALGTALPGGLRELYSYVGAGRFRHRVLTTEQGDEFGVHALIPARAGGSGAPDVVATYSCLVLEKHLIPAGHIPFARGGGGDIYTVTDDGRVLFWPMDGDPAPRAVAPTIQMLLEGLTEFD